ncbi:unnamed protein product, partial [Discosporangium mesarthrocarpum]
RGGRPYFPTLFNGSPIVWRTRFSTEAEWTVVAHGMCHCIFIRGIPAEMGVPQVATVWYGDNRGALQALVIARFDDQTKHVNIKLRRTREHIARGFFDVQFVPTTKQLADIYA